jgi:hypothetical protein
MSSDQKRHCRQKLASNLSFASSYNSSDFSFLPSHLVSRLTRSAAVLLFLTYMLLHLLLRSGTDVTLLTTLWHRCYTCYYALAQMLHLLLRSGTDVSLAATLWYRCFTSYYALAQTFHLPLRSGTDVSLITTLWHRRFTCRYAL